MKNVILIAGRKERYYYDAFIKPCKVLGVTLYLFDPSMYPTEANFAFVIGSDGRVTGHLNVLNLCTSQESLVNMNIADIHVCWYLRENRVVQGGNKTSLEERFAHNETRQAIRALFSILPCKWINSSESIDRVNSNKPYQQVIAALCGLATPRTIVANDHAGVLRFMDDRTKLLLKSLGCVRLDDENNYALYSELFSREEIGVSKLSVQSCPILGQDYIEKRFEYRVMVIGGRVLACEIDSQSSEKTKIDWRHYDLENVTHRQVDLPADVERKLLEFMAAVDLRYGALDMIETPEGEFVFLEVNPSGQWGWIADLAGLPIPSAVADMLSRI